MSAITTNLKMVTHVRLLLCVIAALLPLTESIYCYDGTLDHTADNCKYCGFANITSNNIPSVTYKCLQTSDFVVQGIKSTETNVCENKQYGGNLGSTIYAAIYVCNKDKCNDSCHNSASSAEISYVIVGLLGFVFAIKERL
uniref:Protein quiver n=2 Tax=Panagrellus redivivus TaxID=6233 RepID=A0A7E5A0U7_PANRE